MKRILISSAAILGLLSLAGTAGAVTTGTVTINGTVPAKCSVDTLTDAKNLGADITDANGHLLTGLSNSTSISPNITSTFSLLCTSANASVSVLSTALGNTSVATAPTGYSRALDFTGQAAIDYVSTASSGTALIPNASSALAASTTTLGSGNYLSTLAGNIRVTAWGFNPGVGTPVMTAGTYSGTIVVTITP